MNDQLLEVALKAVQLYAESHPRPLHVTQKQAAEMIGVSEVTMCRMVKAKTIRLNEAGYIPISEVDRILEAKAA